MVAGKDFLDLPAELRNAVYEHVVRGIDVQHHDYYSGFEGLACTKKPGAVMDPWDRTTYSKFFNNEIFRSASAIIATNHQIHAEFYAVLRNYSIKEAAVVTFNVLDMDFQPLIDWFTKLPDAEKLRFQGNNTGSIHVALGFLDHTDMGESKLKKWLLFSEKLNINSAGYDFITLYPLRKERIAQGPQQYPGWMKCYCNFVNSFDLQMSDFLWDINPDMDSAYYANHLHSIRTALRRSVRDFQRMEKESWKWSEDDSDALSRCCVPESEDGDAMRWLVV